MAEPSASGGTEPARNINETELKRALLEHIEQVLFAEHPDGASFRRVVLGDKTADQCEQIKREMIAQASRWSSKARGWEKDSTDGVTVFNGRLYQLHTEIRVDRSKRVFIRFEVDAE